MLSCDTFVLPAVTTLSGSIVMAKNSDRPLGEAQVLTWTEGAEHARGETVQCTYISVPQAEKTYGVLGSKPYWIWGYEMGVNEKGVMIGNEAQGSRAAETGDENALLGMDLLRPLRGGFTHCSFSEMRTIPPEKQIQPRHILH